MPLVATIAQEMLSFYALCDRLKEDFNPTVHTSAGGRHTHNHGHSSSSHGGSRHGSMTPMEGSTTDDVPKAGMEVNSLFLVNLLSKMRTQREVDTAQGGMGIGRPTAINKVLERAQAAG